MANLSERGFAHLLLFLILAAVIGTAIYFYPLIQARNDKQSGNNTRNLSSKFLDIIQPSTSSVVTSELPTPTLNPGQTKSAFDSLRERFGKTQGNTSDSVSTPTPSLVKVQISQIPPQNTTQSATPTPTLQPSSADSASNPSSVPNQGSTGAPPR